MCLLSDVVTCLVCITVYSSCSIIEETLKIKVKVKSTLEEAMKAQRGSRDIALLFL